MLYQSKSMINSNFKVHLLYLFYDIICNNLQTESYFIQQQQPKKQNDKLSRNNKI